MRLKKVSEQIKLNDGDFNVIGDVFETLRFRGSVFFASKLAAPWGFLLEQSAFPRFHVSISGSFYLSTGNKNVVCVQEREIIMLANDGKHWIADQPDRELIPSEQARKACRLGQPLFQQGKITNHIVCGLVNYDRKLSHPVFDSFPSILHFSKFEPSDPIWVLVNLIVAEMNRTNGCGGLIVDRLAEALFLQLMNRYFLENKETIGFFAALKDRQVHQALKLIHKEPASEWSLSLLSERVGMSRATLVRHFQDTIGIPPMAYVMNWRILKAYNLIKSSSIPLEKVAESVGFMSAKTLSKTFQRYYDCTPSELRTNSKQRVNDNR